MSTGRIFRPRGYGLTAELKLKQAVKFDYELANDCFTWMRAVLKDGGHVEEAEALPDKINSPIDVQAPLRDGVILCKIANVVKPNCIKKINTSKIPFKMMENTNNFLQACQKMGVVKMDLFQTVDLYEAQNITQVINGIVALGRKVQTLGYDGPELGPVEATHNKRDFSIEQLRASQGIIGLQAGSNKGASQTGQNFGKTRAIID